VVCGVLWAAGHAPVDHWSAGIAAVEDDRWMVLLSGYQDVKPGRTPEEFRRICASLPDQIKLGATAELIGEIAGYKHADSRRRDFGAVERFPARLVSVGDAVASFNPVYGQGMTSAALHASALSEYLRSAPDLTVAAWGFFALQRVVVDAAWQTSATPDLALPHINGPYPRGHRLAEFLIGQVIEAAVVDEEINRRFSAVIAMRDHPSVLAKPGTLLRSMWALRRDRRNAVGSLSEPAGPA
jgi:2-polyprenyl-6-methoxyphenol hydroxylase-like FAD-dependent oxidoreductase